MATIASAADSADVANLTNIVGDIPTMQKVLIVIPTQSIGRLPDPKMQDFATILAHFESGKFCPKNTFRGQSRGNFSIYV